MKNIQIILGIIVALIIKGCTGQETVPDTVINEMAGTYLGTLRSSNGMDNPAQAELSISNDDQIIFHCYNDSFDSTMILNIYQHHDSIMACNTGEAFEMEYGHSMGYGHMMHGNNATGTSWEHHLTDEHVQGDMHYGFYGQKDHMFYYTFQMSEDNVAYELKFQGEKQ